MGSQAETGRVLPSGVDRRNERGRSSDAMRSAPHAPKASIIRTLDRGDRLVLAAVLLVSWTDLRLVFNLTVSDVLLFVYVISNFGLLSREGRHRVGYSTVWAMLIIVPGVVVSILSSDYLAIELGIRAGISIALPVLAMRYYFGIAAQHEVFVLKLRRLCRWFSYGSILWLAVTIQGSFPEENIFRGRSGPTDHVTSAGIFLATCLVLGVCELASGHGRFLHGGAVVIASIIGLGMNASRTALVVFIPLFLLGLKLARGRLPKFGSRVLLGGMGVGLLVLFGKVRFTSLGGGLLARLNSSNSYSAGSSHERLLAFVQGWQEFLNSPLYGHGFRGSRLAHSVIVQILRTSGAIGGVGLAIVIARIRGACQCLAARDSFPFGLLMLTVFLLVIPNTQAWDRFVWILPIAVLTVSHALGGRVHDVASTGTGES